MIFITLDKWLSAFAWSNTLLKTPFTFILYYPPLQHQHHSLLSEFGSAEFKPSGNLSLCSIHSRVKGGAGSTRRGAALK